MKRAVAFAAIAQLAVFTAAAADVGIHFDQPLQDWDGFGVNYVEACQTRDFARWPQDYGGFSTLSEAKRQQIIEMVFGNDGLQPAIVKMFLDSLHEGMDKSANDNDDPFKINLEGYDHDLTTMNMRYFVCEGLKQARAGGRGFTVIVTMYGPQPWATKQKIVRGRDLDPAEKYEAAEYLCSWAKFLREKEGLPVKYVSFHNEGDSPNRWPKDGTDNEQYAQHDYNMHWPPGQVVDFLIFTREILDKNGMEDVGITPGECTHWDKFDPYAAAIAKNDRALANLALITSHGFRETSGKSIATLRAKRPELHAWTTSATWGKMKDNKLLWLKRMTGLIYTAKTNAFIPWALVQRHSQWVGGDPNPRCAFTIDDEGSYEVLGAYYQYKQLTRAGQAGMKIAAVSGNVDSVWALAFAGNGTKHPNAFVIFNDSNESKDLTISVSGAGTQSFSVVRTVLGENEELYMAQEDVTSEGGNIAYSAPGMSVTTFTAK